MEDVNKYALIMMNLISVHVEKDIKFIIIIIAQVNDY